MRMNFLRQKIKNQAFVVTEQVVAACCLFGFDEDLRFLSKLAVAPDLNHELLLSFEQHHRYPGVNK